MGAREQITDFLEESNDILFNQNHPLGYSPVFSCVSRSILSNGNSRDTTSGHTPWDSTDDSKSLLLVEHSVAAVECAVGLVV